MKKSGDILIKTGKGRSYPDESAHEGCAIEWWFTQGYYDGPRRGRRFFMASAFRHRPDSKGADFPYGYSLLLSVLDPKEGKARSLSRLDPNSLDAAQRDTEDLNRVNLDRKLLEMYCREIRDHGAPSIFQVEKAAVRLASHPFSLEWKDFSVGQSKEDFKLSFIEPENGRRCSFRLMPVRPRMYIEGIGEFATLSMPYATYPSHAPGRKSRQRTC